MEKLSSKLSISLIFGLLMLLPGQVSVAQTPTPVLSQQQQDFIKALCLTLLSDPETPGNVLAPGMTADRWCDARVTDAFMVANWDALLASNNNHESRITVLEVPAAIDVVALEARVVLLETQVAILEAALTSVKTALGTP